MQKHKVLAFRLFFLVSFRAAQEGVCYCLGLPSTAQSALIMRVPSLKHWVCTPMGPLLQHGASKAGHRVTNQVMCGPQAAALGCVYEVDTSASCDGDDSVGLPVGHGCGARPVYPGPTAPHGNMLCPPPVPAGPLAHLSSASSGDVLSDQVLCGTAIPECGDLTLEPLALTQLLVVPQTYACKPKQPHLAVLLAIRRRPTSPPALWCIPCTPRPGSHLLSAVRRCIARSTRGWWPSYGQVLRLFSLFLFPIPPSFPTPSLPQLFDCTLA